MYIMLCVFNYMKQKMAFFYTIIEHNEEQKIKKIENRKKRFSYRI